MAKVLEAAIDPIELSLRIAEVCCGMKRPPGSTAAEAFEQLRSSQPDMAASFNRAAIVAAEYFVECINKSGNFAEMN